MKNPPTGQIVIYKASDGQMSLNVKLEKETVWLAQNQIAELFGTQRPAITKHLTNIFREGELFENSVSSILEHTAADGKTYQTKFYNLDAIISVGYRVNSNRLAQIPITHLNSIRNPVERKLQTPHTSPLIFLNYLLRLSQVSVSTFFLQFKNSCFAFPL